MINPAFSRQNNRDWPTPLVEDILFAEVVDVSRVCPPGVDPPDYGTTYASLHSASTLYPNHKLCFIENVDEMGLKQRWWYVADRDSQHTYNYSITYLGGDTRYPRITRTYIVPRGTAPIALGTADVASVFSGFSYFLTDTGGHYTNGGDAYGVSEEVTGVLIAQSEDPIEGQIGSLYVRQTRIYEVIPGSDDTISGSGQTQNDSGYTVTRLIEDKDFLRLVWTITLPRAVADAYQAVPHTACLIPGYENLILVNEEIKADSENNQKSQIVRVYQGNMSGANHPSPPVISSEKELPGVFPPEKYLEMVITQTRTTLIVDPNSLVPDTPVTSADATVPSNYVLLAIKVTPDGTVTGQRSEITKYYSAIRTLSGSQWDDNLRDNVTVTSTVMTPEDAALAVTNRLAGTEVTVTPYSAYWSIVTTEAPTETLLTGTDRSYFTSMPFSWPAVLTELNVQSLGHRYPRGGAVAYTEKSYVPQYKEAWTGICKAKVTVAWSKTAPILIPTIQAMTPLPAAVNWPVGSVSIKSCLHIELEFSGTTGTEHPDYDYAAFYVLFPATSPYTDWPSSLVVDYDVKPYRGGYLQRKVEVYKPY